MRKGYGFLAFLVYVLINAALVVFAVLFTLYVGPAAVGSGIAEVKVGKPMMAGFY